MRIIRALLPFVMLATVGVASGRAQTAAPPKGSLLLKAQINVKGPPAQKLIFKRKRFYLFRGGLADNRALTDRLKATEFVSRDCYYCGLKPKPPSSEFIAWLKERDCESPFCRAVSGADIAKVPEFKAAYDKGQLAWRQKPAVARDWLVTNLLPVELRDGFYDQRKAVIKTLLMGLGQPLQSAMTDDSSQARFIDIPLAATAKEKFLVSNLVPSEIGNTSYLFACEISVGAEKVETLTLTIPAKTNCVFVQKELPSCSGGVCTPK